MYESMLSHPLDLFSQFDRIRREFDEARGVTGLPSSIRSVAPGQWPAVNIGRTPTSVEVYAFAPGLDASKIDVTLERGVLRISGERQPTIPEGDAKLSVYTRERGAGSFVRAVSLPDDIDSSQVHATYRDGILRVSVARRDSEQPKRISVQ